MLTDLGNSETEELFLQAWKGKDMVHVQIGFINLSFSIEEFKAVTDFMEKTKTKLEDIEHKEV